ncbi:hypothetical protein, partial [Methylogaea oryzae]|uniref:hypothetical protein n=1 Tax=Methylogaea oryzae TaxID=1295382 RepID=UPI0012E2F380
MWICKRGARASRTCWWFADSGWSEDRYKVRTLALDPLPDGVYLLQAVQGKNEAQCLIQVSSLAVQVKQSSEQLLVRVIDREQQPVADAKVSYRDGRGQWQAFPKPTDANGETAYASPAGNVDGKLVVKVEAADLSSPSKSAQELGAETVSPLLPQGEGRDEGRKGR